MVLAHVQSTIRDPIDSSLVDVDSGISNLIEMLWSAGLHTYNSCQENRPGAMWIEFACSAELEEFLNMIGSEIGNDLTKFDNLFYRIIGEEDTDCWVYSICPRDFRDIVDHEKREVYTDFSMPCSIEFSASVRFPVSDYDTICNLLQQSVKRRKS